MRLLLTFLFALGVLTGTGGRIFAPKAAPAPAPAAASAPAPKPPAAGPNEANPCPRCGPSARRTTPVGKVTAEVLAGLRPTGT